MIGVTIRNLSKTDNFDHYENSLRDDAARNRPETGTIPEYRDIRQPYS